MAETSPLALATTKTCSRPFQTVSDAREEDDAQTIYGAVLAATALIARSAFEALRNATAATWSEVALVAIFMATVASYVSQMGRSRMGGLSFEAPSTEGSTSAAGTSASTSPAVTAPGLPI